MKVNRGVSFHKEMYKLIKDEQTRTGSTISEIVAQALNHYFADGKHLSLPRRYRKAVRKPYEERSE